MKQFLKNFLIFCVGFMVYQTIEGIGKTFNLMGDTESFTMGILGGLAILFIGQLNKWFTWEFPIWAQALIGGVWITLLELITGCIFNLWLLPKLGKPIIWSYNGVPLNFCWHQIDLIFSCIWCCLSVVAILVDDYLRWKVYDEEQPYYVFWKGGKRFYLK